MISTRRALPLLLLLAALPLAAQTVTVSKPGATPTVTDCAGVRCTVTIDPAPITPPACTYTVTPTAIAFTAVSSTRTVAVTPSRPDCPWSPIVTAPWLTPAAAPGGFSVAVAANTDGARTTNLIVGGQIVTVTQAAAAVPDPDPPVTGTLLARLNCTPETHPACGYVDARNGLNDFATSTLVGNGSRFTYQGTSTQQQRYLGWPMRFAASTANALYVQMHLTVHGPLRPQGPGDVWGAKFLIVDDGIDSLRPIANLRPTQDDRNYQISYGKNIGGLDVSTPAIVLPMDQRVALQFEVRRGASGRTAIWMNNTDVSRPTVVSPTFNWPIANFFSVSVGWFAGAVSTTGGVAYTIEDVRVTDAFDAGYR